MTIINSQLGGKKPTGTKNITANDVYNVTDYASADVQVPTTAPERYLEFGKDANNFLIEQGTTMINLNGITGIEEYVLNGAYKNSLLTGTVDLSNIATVKSHGMDACFQGSSITGVSLNALTTVQDYGMANCFDGCTGISNSSINLSNLSTLGSYGCYYMFSGCTGITGTVDLSGLTTINSPYACSYMFNGCTGITGVDLSNVTSITGNYACDYMFNGCIGITGHIDLSNVTSITGNYACDYMFNGCTEITGVDLSNVTSITGNYACDYMFNGCTEITGVDLSNVTSITGTHACDYMFQNCTGITGHIDLSKLTTAGSDYACNRIFKGCTGITSIDLSGLKSVSGGYNLNEIVQYCTSLTTIDLSSLVVIGSGSWCMGTICEYCSGLTTAKLDSLSSVSPLALERAFGWCTSLQTLSFPALKSVGSTGFKNLISGVSGCTIHFPSNLDPQGGSTVISSLTSYPNFGGTNTVLAFDLPATNTLTGADSQTYSRNPKYDTVTALAWKVGTYTSLDLTPAYYTSGTTDPQVGDTIYSDSACTTAVTTINSIA